MSENLKIIIELRKYLLGQIIEQDEIDLIEDRLLEDREYFSELERVEEELIESYVFDELNEEELKGFKKLFLTDPERLEKIKFTKLLRNYAANSNQNEEASEKRGFWGSWFFKPQFAFGLVLILVVAGGFLVWSNKNSNNNSNIALADLFSIYEKERPVESRIVGFNYSPLVVLRGNNADSRNENKKRKIERQLLEKVDENPTTESYNALGIYYLTERKFDDAINQFESGLKLNPNSADINSNLGAAYFEKAGQSKDDEKLEVLPKALESLNKAIELDSSRTEAIFNKALVLQELNLPRDAIKTWNEYLEKDKTSKWADEGRKKLEELKNLKTNAFKSKDEILEDFLKAFRAKNDSLAWQIHSQTKESTTLRFLPNQLARRFIEAKKEHLPDKSGESLAAIKYIGNLEASESADFFFKDIASFYEKINENDLSKLDQAFNLSEEGYGFFGKSDYQKAQIKFEQSRDSFTEIGDVFDAKTLEPWISQCLARKGNVEESRRVLSDLVEFSKERNYKWLEASGLDLKATMFFLDNDFSKAIETNKEALKISEEISDTYKQQRILIGLTEIYTRIGESEKALFYLKKALAMKDLYFQSDRQSWRNYIYGSEVFSRLNLADAAIAFGNENLELGGEILNNQAVNHNSNISLSKLYTAKKDYENALEKAEKSREIALNLNQDSAQKILLADSEIQIGLIKRLTGNYDEALLSYDKALDLYSQLPSFKREIYYAKKGKLICFQAQNKKDSVERELPEVVELYEKYRTQILQEQARNIFFDDEQTVYDIAIDSFLAKGETEKAFEYSENSKARSLLDFFENKAELKNNEIEYTTAVKSLGFKEIQEKIPSETQLLQFSVLSDKIIAFIFDKNNLKSVKIEVKQTELEQKVDTYLETIVKDKDNLNLINKQSAEIYKLLILPIVEDLDTSKEIFIIPDKVLNCLPFASLYSDESRRYLIEDFTLASTPSATIFVLASEKGKSKNNTEKEKVLAIGNPAFNQNEYPNLLSLKAAEREVQNISEIYPQTAMFTGEKATKEIFLRELQKNDILHFAGHYLANKTSLLNSKLLLADNQSSGSDLRAVEIAAQKNPNLKLAVLSACQTGIEKYYNGEGAVGIARFFLAIGVPVVVASQWEVDSESTADLMINLHKNRKNNSTAKALQQAQIEAIKNTNKSPFYWSAFNSVGGFTQY